MIMKALLVVVSLLIMEDNKEEILNLVMFLNLATQQDQLVEYLILILQDSIKIEIIEKLSIL